MAPEIDRRRRAWPGEHHRADAKAGVPGLLRRQHGEQEGDGLEIPGSGSGEPGEARGERGHDQRETGPCAAAPESTGDDHDRRGSAEDTADRAREHLQSSRRSPGRRRLRPPARAIAAAAERGGESSPAKSTPSAVPIPSASPIVYQSPIADQCRDGGTFGPDRFQGIQHPTPHDPLFPRRRHS